MFPRELTYHYDNQVNEDIFYSLQAVGGKMAKTNYHFGN